MSTMNIVKASRPLPGAVRQSTSPMSLKCAPEVHTFCPVIRQPSPSRTARVAALPRSEPAPGSLNS